MPVLAEAVIRPLTYWIPSTKAVFFVYAAYATVALSLFLATLYAYGPLWAPDVIALLGTLAIAAMITVALDEQYFQPWSLLEPSLFGIGLWGLAHARLGLVALIVALAGLTRETAVFLPLAALLVWGRPTRRSLAYCGGLMAIWATVFLGLRLGLGSAPAVMPVAEVWVTNLTPEGLRRTLVNVSCGLVPLLVMAVWGWRRAAQFPQRVAWLVPAYLAVLLPFAVWWEVRLWMSLYPVLLPLVLAAISPSVAAPGGSAGK